MSIGRNSTGQAMISTHLEHLKAEGYAVASVKAAKYWLELLEKQFPGKLADLKAYDLTAFQQRLRQPSPSGKLYAEGSINQAVEAVRRFYRWAAAGGLVTKDPTTHLVTRRPPPAARHELSPRNALKLLSQPDISTFGGCRDRAILGLVLKMRASTGALARLDLEHFQADVGTLLLQGRRRESLSLPNGLYIDLIRYLRKARPTVAQQGEQAFFVGEQGGRMACAFFRNIIRNHAKRAGVPRPHSTFTG